MTEIVNQAKKEQSDIAEACRLLKQGELVAFPTETVYGLGADAANAQALWRLYETKGRPSWHPVIVHLYSVDQVKEWAKSIPDEFYLLAEKFWPGPLTMILKRQSSVLNEVTGGQDTVGLRMPNHPLAQELLKAFGGGIAAPSANKFGRLSATTAGAVKEEFGDEIALILDGGDCSVGIESTIVDLSGSEPKILRPGMIRDEEILAICIASNTKSIAKTSREVDGVDMSDKVHRKLSCEKIDDTASGAKDSAEGTRAPGMIPVHYAPRTALNMVASNKLAEFLSADSIKDLKVAVISFQSADSKISTHDLNTVRPERAMHASPLPYGGISSWIKAPADPTEYARTIYNNLRTLDRLHKDLIVVEEPPDLPEWKGIRDRLARASAAR